MEAREHLVSLEGQVLTIERDPANSEALNSVFRSFSHRQGVGRLPGAMGDSKSSPTKWNRPRSARNFQLTITPSPSTSSSRARTNLRRWLTHSGIEATATASSPPARDENLLAACSETVFRCARSGGALPGLAGLAAMVETGRYVSRCGSSTTTRLWRETPKRHEKDGGQGDTGKARLPGGHGRRDGHRRDPGSPRSGTLQTEEPTFSTESAAIDQDTAELQKTADGHAGWFRSAPVQRMWRAWCANLSRQLASR